jgi:putative ABC transport system permease protein
MVTKALLKRKARVAIALAALIIGTGVISAVMSVYYDINLKMGKELRTYGANFVLASKSETFDESKIEDTVKQLKKSEIIGYSPYLYNIGLVEEKRKLVVVGLWFDQIEKLSPYWKIDSDANFKTNDKKAALIGQNIATKMNWAVGKTIKIKDEKFGVEKSFIVKGIVKTGSTEDNQIFINLNEAQKVFSQDEKVNIAYFSILGKSNELNKLSKKINGNLIEVELNSIKQISKSEAKILEKIKSLVYVVVIVILLSTLLCLSTTMMAMVVERRKEIGLRKALGAQNSSIVKEFLGEGLTLGLVGGLLGVILGIGLAQIIGQSVFKSYITLRFEVVFIVTLMSVMVSGLASVVPVRAAANVEPALILKGE